jgi:hypothetical protein
MPPGPPRLDSVLELLAQFLHQVTITEPREIQTAVLAALLRVSAAFIVVTVVISRMAREASDKAPSC